MTSQKSESNILAGWNEEVKPLIDQADFWDFIWRECGRPRNGAIANIRNGAILKYKNEIKKLVANQNSFARAKIAEAFTCKNDRRKFWSEVRRFKNNSKSPSCIEGLSDDKEIADLFAKDTLKNCTTLCLTVTLIHES